MTKLTEVKNAKTLMTEAMDWSVFKWLWEKAAVRQTADDANAALDKLNRAVKAQWPEELKIVYRGMLADERRKKSHPQQEVTLLSHSQILHSLKSVKEMDEKAAAAREDAETTFDEAERQMSTSLAREGCRKAIRSWELHEKAIRAAEALVPRMERSQPA